MWNKEIQRQWEMETKRGIESKKYMHRERHRYKGRVNDKITLGQIFI
jgi:hypothetical protein